MPDCHAKKLSFKLRTLRLQSAESPNVVQPSIVGNYAGTNSGGTCSAQSAGIFFVVPLHFLTLQVQKVVLVSAFVMVSAVWTVSCFLFFCPSVICKHYKTAIQSGGGARVSSASMARCLCWWVLSWWSVQFVQFLVCCSSTHGFLPCATDISATGYQRSSLHQFASASNVFIS